MFFKVDQCQPHENFWTRARQSSQVVICVKTKPTVAGNQILFGGTRFGFTSVGVYYGNTGYGFFKRGYKIYKEFCLKINILKGNY